MEGEVFRQFDGGGSYDSYWLAATWDNQSPGESSSNTLRFRITSAADFSTTNTTPFTGYTQLSVGSQTIGGNDYIKNQSSPVQTANFNISGNGYIGGNVGIGTPSPSYKLDVNGALRANQYIWNGGVNWSMLDDNNEYSFDFANASGNAYWHVWDPTHGPILAVRNNGKVGIGTSGPQEALHVIGNTRVSSLAGTGNRIVAADANGTLTTAGSGINIGGQTTNGASHYQWEGATYRNPGDHTPTLLLRADNPTTGTNGFRPALTLYNFNGALNSTVGMVFASNEEAGIGNTADLAGIMAVKESAGNNNAWSQGGLQFFTKNFGTKIDALRINAAGRVNILQPQGGDPYFTGLEDPTNANGRAQLVMSSSYSDLVIASSEVNPNHGSTLTFATYNPSDANDYRKFVVNQGNWGARRGFLDFGYSDAGGRTNPHSNINGTDNVLTLDGFNKRVGIGTIAPGNKLGIGLDANDVIPALGANGGSFGIFKKDGNATGNYGFMMGVLGSGSVFQQVQRIDGLTDVYNLLLQPNGGNVGIGETSPNAPLTIKAASTADQALFQSWRYQAGSDQYTLKLKQTVTSGVVRYTYDMINNYTAYNNVLTFDRGNVGIGIANPTYTLHVNGRLKTNGINETSDERLKKDIQPISNALQEILAMRGVTYSWRTDEYPDMVLEKGKQYGLIAQELEKVIPELVKTDKEGWKSIEYSHLVPVLIEALKEQQNIIDAQKSEIKKLSASTDTKFLQLEEKIQKLNDLLGFKTQK